MIRLDLRTALPELIRACAAGEIALGQCRYSGPCAIGAMMTPNERAALQASGRDGQLLRQLAAEGLVSFPDPDQLTDAAMLQSAFDGGSRALFERELGRLQEKYL